MNRTFLRKLFSILIAAAFALFLFWLSLLTAWKYLTSDTTVSYYENRTLAVFPQFEAESILDGTFFKGVEDWLRDHSAKREGILAYSTAIDMLLCRPVVNDIVIAGDKLLPYNAPEIVDEKTIKAQADQVSDNLKSHSDLCKSYGGSFYYIAIPNQSYYYADGYPDYLNSREEYTEKATDAFFSALDEKGVSYIDMLPFFDADGHLPEYSSYVDHHFSIFGALKTYSVFMDRLNADTGLDIPVLEDGKYTVETLENPYLGSRARKLMGSRETDEKISLIYPVEDIPYVREDWFTSSTGCNSVYSLPQTASEDVSYSVYMGGDISFTRLTTNREELPSILIYGGSFTNAFECIAWYSFDTMYSLDFRYYKDMSLEEFIAEYKPDVVVCMLDYNILLDPSENGQ